MDAITIRNTKLETKQQAAEAIRNISGDLFCLLDCYRCAVLMPIGHPDPNMILCRVLTLIDTATDIFEAEANLLSDVADFFD